MAFIKGTYDQRVIRFYASLIGLPPEKIARLDIFDDQTQAANFRAQVDTRRQLFCNGKFLVVTLKAEE